MRIDLNSSVPQRVETEKSAKSDAATNRADSTQESDGTHVQDTVRLTGLASQAMSMPEVRQDMVARLRQSVQSGQYSVDPQKVAEAMLQHAAR
jgi:flagellar biosynthesis anti-sigma factor FlgM